MSESSSRISELVLRLENNRVSPTLLGILFDVLVGGSFDARTNSTIVNAHVAPIIFDLLKNCSEGVRSEVLDYFVAIIPQCFRNVELCRNVGLPRQMLQSLLGNSWPDQANRDKLSHLLYLMEFRSASVRGVKDYFRLLNRTTQYSRWPMLVPVFSKDNEEASGPRVNGPSTYFDLDGTTSSLSFAPLEAWPKEGYTMCMWLRIDADRRGVHDESVLVSMVTDGGDGVELALVGGGLQVSVFSSSKAKKIVHGDKQIEPKKWHFITVAHQARKQLWNPSEMTVTLNGVVVFYGVVDYPKFSNPLTRCGLGCTMKPMQGSSSPRDESSKFMRGQIGCFYLLEGALLLEHAREMFFNGGQPSFTVDVESTDDSVVHLVFRGGKWRTRLLRICSPALEMHVTDKRPPRLARQGSSDSSMRNQFTSFISAGRGHEFNKHWTIVAHGRTERIQTYWFSHALSCVGGVKALLPLFERLHEVEHSCDEPCSRLSADALLAIAQALRDSPENKDAMLSIQGFAMIAFMMERQPREFLNNDFILAADAVRLAVFDNSDLLREFVLHILFNFRLWRNAEVEVQQGVMNTLADVVEVDPQYFRGTVGVQFIIDAMRTHYYYGQEPDDPLLLNQVSQQPLLMNVGNVGAMRVMLLRLVRIMVRSGIMFEEVQCIVLYLQDCQDYLQNVDMLEFLLELMFVQTKAVLQYLDGLGGLDLFFSLLDRNDEKCRLLVLKLICKIFVQSDDKNKQRFNSAHGFACLTRVLLNYPFTLQTYRMLYELLVEDISDGMDEGSSSLRYGVERKFKNPGVISTVYNLLPDGAMPLCRTVLTDFEIGFENFPGNRDVFMSCFGWQSWLLRVLVAANRSTHSLALQVHNLVIKLFRVLLQHSLNQPRGWHLVEQTQCFLYMFSETSSSVDWVAVARAIFADVLRKFLHNPHSPALSSAAPSVDGSESDLDSFSLEPKEKKRFTLAGPLGSGHNAVLIDNLARILSCVEEFVFHSLSGSSQSNFAAAAHESNNDAPDVGGASTPSTTKDMGDWELLEPPSLSEMLRRDRAKDWDDLGLVHLLLDVMTPQLNVLAVQQSSGKENGWDHMILLQLTLLTIEEGRRIGGSCMPESRKSDLDALIGLLQGDSSAKSGYDPQAWERYASEKLGEVRSERAGIVEKRLRADVAILRKMVAKDLSRKGSRPEPRDKSGERPSSVGSNDSIPTEGVAGVIEDDPALGRVTLVLAAIIRELRRRPHGMCNDDLVSLARDIIKSKRPLLAAKLRTRMMDSPFAVELPEFSDKSPAAEFVALLSQPKWKEITESHFERMLIAVDNGCRHYIVSTMLERRQSKQSELRKDMEKMVEEEVASNESVSHELLLLAHGHRCTEKSRLSLEAERDQDTLNLISAHWKVLVEQITNERGPWGRPYRSEAHRPIFALGDVERPSPAEEVANAGFNSQNLGGVNADARELIQTSSKREQRTFWILSPSEDSLRRRRVLEPNLDGSDHRDARLVEGDSGNIVAAEEAAQSPTMVNRKTTAFDVPANLLNRIRTSLMPKSTDEPIAANPVVLNALDGISVAEGGSAIDEDDGWDLMTGPDNDMGYPLTGNHDGEKKAYECKCEMITTREAIPGTLTVKSSFVTFSPDQSASADGAMNTLHQNVRWPMNTVKGLHHRRYLLCHTAIEFFFTDNTTSFMNMPTRGEKNKVYRAVLRARPQNLLDHGRDSIEMFNKKKLTEKWVSRQITNFEYLMALNTYGGRTYNDLTQYPVFPWIIADYSSTHLDLTKRSTFRDLTKPVGALNPERLELFLERYEMYDDPNIPKFHYGSHYSSIGTALYYMLRVEPYTSLFIKFQGGKFDQPDRMFHSIPQAWQNCLNNRQDVKELIPEFFYFPEMLENHNGFDLGVKQDGEPIGDVVLPPWARSAEEFIKLNRDALESEFVSENIHHWIDLIFGYKQQGQAAIDAHNVFYYLTYEGMVDVNAINDPVQRKAVEVQIANFGQTPKRLFNRQHPKRASLPSPYLERFATLFDESIPAWLHTIQQVTDFGVPLCFVQCMDDKVITLGGDRKLTSHKWSSAEKSTNNTTFELDRATYAQGKGRTLHRKSIGIPLARGLRVGPHLVATIDSGSKIITTGHFDCSVKISDAATGRLLFSTRAGTDVATCLAVSRDEKKLAIGFQDTAVSVWDIVTGPGGDISLKRVSVLFGHDDVVNCIAVDNELGIVISSSLDICIVHSIHSQTYIRTICPCPNGTVTKTAILDPSGSYFVAYTDLSGCSYVTTYSLNGKLLARTSFAGRVKDAVCSPKANAVIVGGEAQSIAVYNMNNLKCMKTLACPSAVVCLALSGPEQHLLVGLEIGKIMIYGSKRQEGRGGRGAGDEPNTPTNPNVDDVLTAVAAAYAASSQSHGSSGSGADIQNQINFEFKL